MAVPALALISSGISISPRMVSLGCSASTCCHNEYTSVLQFLIAAKIELSAIWTEHSNPNRTELNPNRIRNDTEQWKIFQCWGTFACLPVRIETFLGIPRLKQKVSPPRSRISCAVVEATLQTGCPPHTDTHKHTHTLSPIRSATDAHSSDAELAWHSLGAPCTETFTFSCNYWGMEMELFLGPARVGSMARL